MSNIVIGLLLQIPRVDFSRFILRYQKTKKKKGKKGFLVQNRFSSFHLQRLKITDKNYFKNCQI